MSQHMNIVQYPADVLTTPARKIVVVDDKIRLLAGAMFETMREHGGIGLAAPQVDIPLRLIIGEGPGWTFALANPVVLKSSSQLTKNSEGCLSFKGKGQVVVERPKQIRVCGLDMTGAERVFKARGLLAMCLQHEIDHLNGITLADQGLT